MGINQVQARQRTLQQLPDEKNTLTSCQRKTSLLLVLSCFSLDIEYFFSINKKQQLWLKETSSLNSFTVFPTTAFQNREAQNKGLHFEHTNYSTQEWYTIYIPTLPQNQGLPQLQYILNEKSFLAHFMWCPLFLNG